MTEAAGSWGEKAGRHREQSTLLRMLGTLLISSRMPLNSGPGSPARYLRHTVARCVQECAEEVTERRTRRGVMRWECRRDKRCLERGRENLPKKRAPEAKGCRKTGERARLEWRMKTFKINYRIFVFSVGWIWSKFPDGMFPFGKRRQNLETDWSDLLLPDISCASPPPG